MKTILRFSSLFVALYLLAGNINASAFPVTFTVIDQKEIYTNIKFKGTPTEWATVAMVQDPTYTWTLTLDLVPGTYEWGAIEDDGSEWGIWLIEGPNPSFTVSEEGAISGTVTYTILPPGDKAVTFRVDITDFADFNPEVDFIDLAGDFTSWGGSDPFEVDPENANIYTFTSTATLRPNQVLKFKFRLNGVWDPSEAHPTWGAETPADPDGKLNRVFVVSAVEEENVYSGVWGENYFHNLGEVAAIADIEAALNATVGDLNLPATVSVTLGVPSNLTAEVVELPVVWNTENFESASGVDQVIEGAIGLEEGGVTYYNGYNLKATVNVIVDGTSVPTNNIQFSMFPNPTSGDLNITAANQINTIRIVNVLGQQVMNLSNVARENVVLPTSNLSAGVYIITINGQSSRFIKK